MKPMATPLPHNAVGRQMLADHQSKRRDRIKRLRRRDQNPPALTLMWTRMSRLFRQEQEQAA